MANSKKSQPPKPQKQAKVPDQQQCAPTPANPVRQHYKLAGGC